MAFGKSNVIGKLKKTAAAARVRGSGSLRQNVATRFAPNGLLNFDTHDLAQP
jgi:hypothetical protein